MFVRLRLPREDALPGITPARAHSHTHTRARARTQRTHGRARARFLAECRWIISVTFFFSPGCFLVLMGSLLHEVNNLPDSAYNNGNNNNDNNWFHYYI